MRKQFSKKVKSFLFLLISISAFILFPTTSFAKEVVLSAPSVDVEVGKTINVKVSINTDSDKINAIGFNIEFSTEILEGLIPNQNGSSFPMCATLSSTKYECGITGQNGFSGNGTVTTLVFKGRAAGSTEIKLTNFEARYGPNGDAVTGFSANSITLNVFGEGLAPAQTPESTPAQNSNTSSEEELPADTFLPNSTKPLAELASPGQTLGSIPKVPGKIGSQAEEPLKVASDDTGTANASVKGMFSGGGAQIYVSLLPTFLLLIVAVFFGLRLYGTEKKRHVEMEKLFDRQLGMLSALESKVDLVEQKGDGGKEKFMAEFEQAKEEIKLLESPAAKEQKQAGEEQPGQKNA